MSEIVEQIDSKDNRSAETKNEELILDEKYKGKYYQRFDGYSRILHLMVILSFLTLAVTGMVIKFADVAIFQFISSILGGYEVTGFFHRVAAVMTFAYFILHIHYLLRKRTKKKVSLKYMLMSENSMVPRKQDFIELGQTFKWFLGMGPRPAYGRWTYWEKFDYFAVFWGVAVIGMTGLILWFPEFFTSLGMPGWIINVATIIHSDEALLATGFIFTVHFFNTHFRPDKFPMDMVIFTGCEKLEEFVHDRPRQYKILLENGELDKRIVEAPPAWFVKTARIFGFVALATGLFTVIMIIYSMLFVYK